jgi:hypothetical protein
MSPKVQKSFQTASTFPRCSRVRHPSNRAWLQQKISQHTKNNPRKKTKKANTSLAIFSLFKFKSCRGLRAKGTRDLLLPKLEILLRKLLIMIQFKSLRLKIQNKMLRWYFNNKIRIKLRSQNYNSNRIRSIKLWNQRCNRWWKQHRLRQKSNLNQLQKSNLHQSLKKYRNLQKSPNQTTKPRSLFYLKIKRK